jgi:hypothetical protein
MVRIADEAIEYQIRRFLRPDWRRFWKPGHENDPLYKLYESAERKFDPEQPRVPRGQSEGGQWTSGDAQLASDDTGVDVDKIVEQAQRLAANSPNRRENCINLCIPLLERFQPPGSDRNEWDFRKCLNRCLGR